MKIVINKCGNGWFGLSKKAYEYLGIDWDGNGYKYNHNRADVELVKCVETLGRAADGTGARLKVVEIPDDVEWEIKKYDGVEYIVDKHRFWE